MPVISNTGIYNSFFFEVMAQKNWPFKKNDFPANLLLINKTLMRICPHLEYKGYPCHVNKTNRKESVNQLGCYDDVFDKMPGFMILMIFDDHLKLDNSHGSCVMSIFSECFWFMDQNHMNLHWLEVDRWDDPIHGLLTCWDPHEVHGGGTPLPGSKPRCQQVEVLLWWNRGLWRTTCLFRWCGICIYDHIYIYTMKYS